MTLAQRLEAYAIALLAALVLTIGAFFVGEFKGKYEQQATSAQQQQAANLKSIDTYAGTLKDRADADAKAADKTNQLIAAVDEGIANAQKKFAGLPTVVMDAHGCARLTDTARMRFNAVELLPAGPADEPAGNAPGAVSAGPVPSTR